MSYEHDPYDDGRGDPNGTPLRPLILLFVLALALFCAAVAGIVELSRRLGGLAYDLATAAGLVTFVGIITLAGYAIR